MTFKLHTELTLDATEERVVWNATVLVYDPQLDEAGEIERWECPFAIDREAAAQEWIDERVAAARGRYGQRLS